MPSPSSNRPRRYRRSPSPSQRRRNRKSPSPGKRRRSPIQALEKKARSLYGSGHDELLVITAVPRSTAATASKDIALTTSKCYIDALHDLADAYTNMSPDALIDTLYSVIGPRMFTRIQINNVNTEKMYDNAVTYAAHVWTIDDILGIKNRVKQAKTNSRYAVVKKFIKDVKFRKTYG